MTKLALHCHRSGPDIAAAIRSANWAGCKQLDGTDMLSVAQQAGIPVRILRVFDVETMAAADAANAIAAYDLAPVTHVQLCCEQRCTDVAWQQAVIDGLAGHGYRGRYLAGGFSTGTCSPSDLQTLAPLFERGDVDLALDEYSGILPDDPGWHQWTTWTSERHRALLPDGTIPPAPSGIRVIVTESGGDNVQPDLTGGGWQTRGWTADQYVGLLTKLDQDDQADGYVICRCVFTLGATPDWVAFEIAPILPQLAAYVGGQPTPTKGTTMQGIDVSSDQPGTDWAKVAAAGVQFAAVKATEGTGYANPFFAADWAGLKGNGLVRIAYHYARPDLNNSPEAEASYFLSQVGQLETSDLLALDIESGAGDLGPWAAAFYEAVDAALGNPALLYSYPSFLDQHGLTMAAVGKRPLWYAGGTDTPPPAPLDWPDVAIWQKVTTEAVAGVAGKVDVDETDLSADQLRALGKPAPGTATGIEAEALAWFEQAGVKLDRTHAIWTATLLPMYQRWRELAAAGDPLADAYHLGPAVAPEYGTTFGGSRPAGAIKLQNAHLGAYLREDGRWQAYLLAI